MLWKLKLPLHFLLNTSKIGPYGLHSTILETKLSKSRDGDCATPRLPVQAQVNQVIADLGPDRTVCEGDSLLPNVSTAHYLWSTGDTTSSILVNQTGLYWLQATDNAGCEDIDSVLLIAMPLPVFSLGNDTIACDSMEIGIAPFPSYQYLWSTGDTTSMLNVDSSGVYSLTVSDQLGCEATYTLNLSIAVPPIVDLGADITKSVTDSIFLATPPPVPGTSYLWSTGSTLNLSIRGKDYGVGTHTVWLRVTDANGCVGSDTFLVTFTDVLGLNDGVGEFGVKVYPNPTTGRVLVEFPHKFHNLPKLTLYNMQGQELTLEQYEWDTPTQLLLNLSNLPTGTYYLRLEADSGKLSGGVRILRK